MKIFRLFFCSFLIFFFPAHKILSQENILVEPPLIEAEAKPRDLLEFSVKIKNLSNSLYYFYTLVEDINRSKEVDESNSLSAWIEIFRARTEIPAGKEKEIPLTIKIPYYAKPGKYFATIIFSRGSDLPDAIANAKKINQPKVFLSVEVKENIIEKLQVRKFYTSKNIFFALPVVFYLEIENIGNKEIEFVGAIHLFNKRGQEIDQIPLEKRLIPAGEVLRIEKIWQNLKERGQIKAVFFGQYAKEGVLQDTVYFWFLPWRFFAFIFLLFIFFVFVLTFFISRKIKTRYLTIFQKRKTFDIIKKDERNL